MGEIKSESCDRLANLIWNWCITRNIWLSAIYLPGRYNIVADTRSRKFNDNTEWMLNHEVFNNVVARYGMPDIDLFASRLNHQLPKYVSWETDPGAVAVDAFSLHWGGMVEPRLGFTRGPQTRLSVWQATQHTGPIGAVTLVRAGGGGGYAFTLMINGAQMQLSLRDTVHQTWSLEH